MRYEESTSESGAKVLRSDFALTMWLLGLIIALALGRIALDGNWQKMLRVSLAFVTYSGVLLFLFQSAARKSCSIIRPPFRMFALAGALAELVSGWLRPDWRASDLLAMTPAAALLIGGLHWLVLRTWRPLRTSILTGRESASNSTPL
jgi:hypothetical protein